MKFGHRPSWLVPSSVQSLVSSLQNVARDLYAKIGIPHMVKELQEQLDSLPPPPEMP